MAERTVARAIVFRDDRVLLIKRAPEQRVAPGAWQCPVGKQEPGEPIEETVRRELREETGLEVIEAVPIGTATSEFVTDGEPTTWHQHSFLVTASDDDVVLSREHSEYRWLALDELDGFGELSERVRSAIERALAVRGGG